VDAVITLCAEEVCPVFLGKAHRIHWGMRTRLAAGRPKKSSFRCSGTSAMSYAVAFAAVFR